MSNPKLRINFDADDWFADFIIKYKKRKRLDSNKDAVQGLFREQEELITLLTAEKPAEAQPSITPSVEGQLDSPPLPQQAQPPPQTSDLPAAAARQSTPTPFNSNLHGAKEPKAVLENGKWTFSKKHLEKLAYEAELQRIKTEGKQARADIDTNEKRKRALERQENSRRNRRMPLTCDNEGLPAYDLPSDWS